MARTAAVVAALLAAGGPATADDCGGAYNNNGEAMPNMPVAATTACECQDACKALGSAAAGWTLVVDKAKCYCRSTWGVETHNCNCTSGKLGDTPAPAPPVTPAPAPPPAPPPVTPAPAPPVTPAPPPPVTPAPPVPTPTPPAPPPPSPPAGPCAPDPSWVFQCVPRRDAGATALQNTLGYICSLPAQICDAINPGGACVSVIPDNVNAKAGYAMQKYYEQNSEKGVPNPGSCDFGGTGAIVPTAGCTTSKGDGSTACVNSLDCYENLYKITGDGPYCTYCDPSTKKCSYGNSCDSQCQLDTDCYQADQTCRSCSGATGTTCTHSSLASNVTRLAQQAKRFA